MADNWRVGDRLLVQTDPSGPSHPGTVAYVGPVGTTAAPFYGIALDEAHGRNDGSVAGVRYFETRPNHGLFVKLGAKTVTLTAMPAASSTVAPPSDDASLLLGTSTSLGDLSAAAVGSTSAANDLVDGWGDADPFASHSSVNDSVAGGFAVQTSAVLAASDVNDTWGSPIAAHAGGLGGPSGGGGGYGDMTDASPHIDGWDVNGPVATPLAQHMRDSDASLLDDSTLVPLSDPFDESSNVSMDGAVTPASQGNDSAIAAVPVDAFAVTAGVGLATAASQLPQDPFAEAAGDDPFGSIDVPLPSASPSPAAIESAPGVAAAMQPESTALAPVLLLPAASDDLFASTGGGIAVAAPTATPSPPPPVAAFVASSPVSADDPFADAAGDDPFAYIGGGSGGTGTAVTEPVTLPSPPPPAAATVVAPSPSPPPPVAAVGPSQSVASDDPFAGVAGDDPFDAIGGGSAGAGAAVAETAPTPPPPMTSGVTPSASPPPPVATVASLPPPESDDPFASIPTADDPFASISSGVFAATPVAAPIVVTAAPVIAPAEPDVASLFGGADAGDPFASLNVSSDPFASIGATRATQPSPMAVKPVAAPPATAAAVAALPTPVVPKSPAGLRVAVPAPVPQLGRAVAGAPIPMPLPVPSPSAVRAPAAASVAPASPLVRAAAVAPLVLPVPVKAVPVPVPVPAKAAAAPLPVPVKAPPLVGLPKAMPIPLPPTTIKAPVPVPVSAAGAVPAVPAVTAVRSAAPVPRAPVLAPPVMPSVSPAVSSGSDDAAPPVARVAYAAPAVARAEPPRIPTAIAAPVRMAAPPMAPSFAVAQPPAAAHVITPTPVPSVAPAMPRPIAFAAAPPVALSVSADPFENDALMSVSPDDGFFPTAASTTTTSHFQPQQQPQRQLPHQPFQQLPPQYHHHLPHHQHAVPVREQQMSPSVAYPDYFRPSVPLWVWGFGGRCFVMKPRQRRPLSSFGTVENVGAPVPGPFEPVNFAKYAQTDPELSLVSSFPGPLRTKASKSQLVAWLRSRIAALSKTALRADDEDALLLWEVLRVMVEHDGEVRGRDALEPSAAQKQVVALLRQPDQLAAMMPAAAVVADAQLDDGAAVAAHVQELEALLLEGRVSAALQLAVNHRMWSHALFLAATSPDPEAFASVRAVFANEASTPGSPLRALYLMLGGQLGSLWASAADATAARWRESAAIILSNGSTANSAAALGALGDGLWSRHGRVHAAHVCYVLAQMTIMPISDPNARLVLLGGDHKRRARLFATPDAVQRSEVWEFAKMQGNSQFSCTELERYKLPYASLLCDLGQLDKAFDYCADMLERISTGPAALRSDAQLVLLIRELEARIVTCRPALKARASGGSSIGLTPLVRGVGSLFGGALRAVVGDGDDAPAAAPAAQVPVTMQGQAVASRAAPVATQSAIPVAVAPAVGKPAPQPKPAAAATQDSGAADDGGGGGGGGGGWGFWPFGKSKTKEVKLGEGLARYYNEELKKWVRPGEEDAVRAAMNTLPPSDAMLRPKVAAAAAAPMVMAVQQPSAAPQAIAVGPPATATAMPTVAAAPVAVSAAPPPATISYSRAAVPGGRSQPQRRYVDTLAGNRPTTAAGAAMPPIGVVAQPPTASAFAAPATGFKMFVPAPVPMPVSVTPEPVQPEQQQPQPAERVAPPEIDLRASPPPANGGVVAAAAAFPPQPSAMSILPPPVSQPALDDDLF